MKIFVLTVALLAGVGTLSLPTASRDESAIVTHGNVASYDDQDFMDPSRCLITLLAYLSPTWDRVKKLDEEGLLGFIEELKAIHANVVDEETETHYTGSDKPMNPVKCLITLLTYLSPNWDRVKKFDEEGLLEFVEELRATQTNAGVSEMRTSGSDDEERVMDPANCLINLFTYLAPNWNRLKYLDEEGLVGFIEELKANQENVKLTVTSEVIYYSTPPINVEKKSPGIHK